MSRDKNTLYVAFKTSKKEIKEQQKEFDKINLYLRIQSLN